MSSYYLSNVNWTSLAVWNKCVLWSLMTYSYSLSSVLPVSRYKTVTSNPKNDWGMSAMILSLSLSLSLSVSVSLSLSLCLSLCLSLSLCVCFSVSIFCQSVSALWVSHHTAASLFITIASLPHSGHGFNLVSDTLVRILQLTSSWRPSSHVWEPVLVMQGFGSNVLMLSELD